MEYITRIRVKNKREKLESETRDRNKSAETRVTPRGEEKRE